MTIKKLVITERRAAKRARRELELALEKLPAPQFEYEIATPDVVTEDDEDDEVDRKNRITEKDRAEVEAEEMERLRKAAEKLYEERSSVV